MRLIMVKSKTVPMEQGKLGNNAAILVVLLISQLFVGCKPTKSESVEALLGTDSIITFEPSRESEAKAMAERDPEPFLRIMKSSKNPFQVHNAAWTLGQAKQAQTIQQLIDLANREDVDAIGREGAVGALLYILQTCTVSEDMRRRVGTSCNSWLGSKWPQIVNPTLDICRIVPGVEPTNLVTVVLHFGVTTNIGSKAVKLIKEHKDKTGIRELIVYIKEINEIHDKVLKELQALESSNLPAVE